METLYREYKDRVQFYLVYVREAHPDDGWQLPANQRQQVIYNTPKQLAERAKIATACIKNLKLSLPVLLDNMDDKVQKTYRAWPARACLVGADGKIVFLSPSSPNGVNPPDIKRALEKLLGKQEEEGKEKRK